MSSKIMSIKKSMKKVGGKSKRVAQYADDNNPSEVYRIQKFDVQYLVHFDKDYELKKDVKRIFIPDSYSGSYKFYAIYQYLLRLAIQTKSFSSGSNYPKSYNEIRVAIPVLKSWDFSDMDEITSYNDRIKVFLEDHRLDGWFRLKIRPTYEQLAASLMSESDKDLLEYIYKEKATDVINYLKKVKKE